MERSIWLLLEKSTVAHPWKNYSDANNHDAAYYDLHGIDWICVCQFFNKLNVNFVPLVPARNAVWMSIDLSKLCALNNGLGTIRRMPLWRRDASSMVIANVLYENSVFLKYSRIAIQRHFKGTEKKVAISALTLQPNYQCCQIVVV